MTDLPSWARVGAKVVCIGAFKAKSGPPYERLPQVGTTYTIRAVGVEPHGVFLTFREIRNLPWPYSDGFGECRFSVRKFRPAVEPKTLAEDVAKVSHWLTIPHSTTTAREDADA